MPEPSEYRHIAAFGAITHAPEHHVREDQELASKEGAPIDATYLSADGWHTYSEIRNADTKRLVDEFLAKEEK